MTDPMSMLSKEEQELVLLLQLSGWEIVFEPGRIVFEQKERNQKLIWADPKTFGAAIITVNKIRLNSRA